MTVNNPNRGGEEGKRVVASGAFRSRKWKLPLVMLLGLDKDWDRNRGRSSWWGRDSSGSSCSSQQQQDIVPVLCAVADVTVITFPHKAHCAVIAKVAVLKPLTAVYIPAVSTVKSRYSGRCSVGEHISQTTKLSAGNRIKSIFSSVSVFSFDRNRFEPKEARLISTSVKFLRFFPHRFRFH